MRPIALSIDVTQLDKSKFKPHTRKSGQKAVFVDLFLSEVKSEWGDGIVKQSQTREEREAGVKMPIIGNWKFVGGEKIPAPKAQEPSNSGDDVPF